MRIFNTVIHLIKIMKDLIHQYAAYDLWANTRMVERLQRENGSVLDRHVKSSFPALGLTLMHARDSGNAWFGRVFGTPVAGLDHGIGSLLTVSVAMNDKVQALDDEMLLRAISYANLKGDKFKQPCWQLLMHCFNHASYHRGQVVTIMRQLDMTDIPTTDLVVYQRLLSARK